MGDPSDLCPEGCGRRVHTGPCRPPVDACTRWTGTAYCGATDDVRQYMCGHRCPSHTPAALAGLPEPPAATPGVPLYRRDHLAAVIASMPEPMTASDLAAVSRDAGWSGNRNTARKDVRALVARGLLIPVSTAGNTSYIRTPKDSSCDSASSAA